MLKPNVARQTCTMVHIEWHTDENLIIEQIYALDVTILQREHMTLKNRNLIET